MILLLTVISTVLQGHTDHDNLSSYKSGHKLCFKENCSCGFCKLRLQIGHAFAYDNGSSAQDAACFGALQHMANHDCKMQ